MKDEKLKNALILIIPFKITFLGNAQKLSSFQCSCRNFSIFLHKGKPFWGKYMHYQKKIEGSYNEV